MSGIMKIKDYKPETFCKLSGRDVKMVDKNHLTSLQDIAVTLGFELRWSDLLH